MQLDVWYFFLKQYTQLEFVLYQKGDALDAGNFTLGGLHNFDTVILCNIGVFVDEYIVCSGSVLLE